MVTRSVEAGIAFGVVDGSEAELRSFRHRRAGVSARRAAAVFAAWPPAR